MSDAARETPENAGSVADSAAAGHGRHRGPAAPSEEPAAPSPGRHRRTPGDAQDG